MQNINLFPQLPFLRQERLIWNGAVILIIKFFTLSTLVCAQELSLEVAAGASGGWWYYTQGHVDDNFDTNKGNAYSESTLTLPIETNLIYSLQRFDIGAGLNASFFVEDEIFGLGNQNASLNKIRVSDGAVTFLRVHLLAAYAILQRKIFTLSPQIKAGLFNIDTSYPDKDNFGAKTFWEAGVMNKISFSKCSLLIYPYYNSMHIHMRNPIQAGEQHKIYSLGIMFGTRWSLYQK